MFRTMLTTAAIALTLSATAASAEIRRVNIEALYEAEALILCNMLADQEGATERGSVRNIDYFLYECRFNAPAMRNVTVEVMPLLHVAQARPVCRDAARDRNGTWTGDWDGNGAFAPGTCTIRVPAG
ncbi:hypothetical protein [Nioella sediminis]|uniref:hypothetical protein n=1 Tax=Nioella sediminis TaxID=1912092 RepID=UPI0008FCF9C1|nr:hypothetical protein [Nioella sediminis]TBX28517.1 hypothetical protein TK43_04990 [Roseovarius sp. JS7-11]